MNYYNYSLIIWLANGYIIRDETVHRILPTLKTNKDSMIHVYGITTFDKFLSIKSIWDKLVSLTDEKQIFFTHDWIKCWWKGYGNEKQLFVLLFRECGEVIGIAPLMVTEFTKKGVKLKKLSLIENDEVANTDFIFPERHDELFSMMLKYLIDHKKKWDYADFRRISEDSITAALLPRVLKKKHLPFTLTEMKRSPYIPIKSNWKCYYDNKPRRFKKRYNYNLNKASRSGKISVHCYKSTDEVMEILPEVFNISHQSWKSRIGKDIIGQENRKIFYTALSEAAAKNGWVNIWVLKLDGQPIAMEYHLEIGGYIYALRGDFDEKYRSYSPGSILEYHIVKNCFKSDCICEYNLCGSDYAYKMLWTEEVRKQFSYCIFNPYSYRSRLIAVLAKFYKKYIKKHKEKLHFLNRTTRLPRDRLKNFLLPCIGK